MNTNTSSTPEQQWESKRAALLHIIVSVLWKGVFLQSFLKEKFDFFFFYISCWELDEKLLIWTTTAGGWCIVLSYVLGGLLACP